MAALPLDGLSLPLPIAPRRKTALKQEVKAADSFTTTATFIHQGAQQTHHLRGARLLQPFALLAPPSFSAILVFSNGWRWFLPRAEAGAPPSPPFHWTAQPFIRGRVSPSGHDSPHLSRAHRSQTPLTQHAPYSLSAVTTRDSSRTKAEKTAATSPRREQSDGRGHGGRNTAETRLQASRMYKH